MARKGKEPQRLANRLLEYWATEKHNQCLWDKAQLWASQKRRNQGIEKISDYSRGNK